jgi:hypothetical protein
MSSLTRSAELDALVSRLDQLALHVAGRIRAAIPGYTVLPVEEHATGVATQLRALVAGLRADEAPSAADLALSRSIGRSRAEAGISLPDVINAYHIAYTELWSELGKIDARHPGDPGATTNVALLLSWLHQLSATMTEAHAEQTHARAAWRALQLRRLVDLLSEARVSENEVRGLSKALGFEPDGPFRVVCVAGADRDEVDRVMNQTTSGGGTVAVSDGSDRAVLIVQGISERTILGKLHQVNPQAVAGVGVERGGAAGAWMSMSDAREALARALSMGRDVRFEDDWLMCVLTAAHDRLRPLIEGAARVATAHPEWAETVWAYAAGQNSVTAAARAVHVHPNSAKYRLERWKAFTGWNPDDFNGLAASLVALDLTGHSTCSVRPRAGRQGRPQRSAAGSA